jgi:hypothetical protein
MEGLAKYSVPDFGAIGWEPTASLAKEISCENVELDWHGIAYRKKHSLLRGVEGLNKFRC